MAELSLSLTVKSSEALSEGVVVDYLQATRGQPLPFNITVFEVQPGCATPLDQHQVEELWIVISGCGVLQSGEAIFRLSQGDSVHFPSRVPHRVHNDSLDRLTIYSIYW